MVRLSRTLAVCLIAHAFCRAEPKTGAAGTFPDVQYEAEMKIKKQFQLVYEGAASIFNLSWQPQHGLALQATSVPMRCRICCRAPSTCFVCACPPAVRARLPFLLVLVPTVNVASSHLRRGWPVERGCVGHHAGRQNGPDPRAHPQQQADRAAQVRLCCFLFSALPFVTVWSACREKQKRQQQQQKRQEELERKKKEEQSEKNGTLELFLLCSASGLRSQTRRPRTS